LLGELQLNLLRGFISFPTANKKPQPFRVEVCYLVEAAGIIRPSSSPLRGRRRGAPALSHHFVARLNPLRVFIPKSTANKKPQPFRVEVCYLVEAAGTALMM
jgi:hypothetical protein